MYSAISTAGTVSSASLGSVIDNGRRERGGQLWHLSSKFNAAPERLRLCRAGRHQSRDGLAAICDRDFVPFFDLGNQCRQVLAGFTYSSLFHSSIVLHVALLCNCQTPLKRPVVKPTLLAGANPQIAKGDGDASVQAYIAAMPRWKHALGYSLDTPIARTVPNVRKAVRWNTPFYGIDGRRWVLGFH
jgi:hypothetical protein